MNPLGPTKVIITKTPDGAIVEGKNGSGMDILELTVKGLVALFRAQDEGETKEPAAVVLLSGLIAKTFRETQSEVKYPPQAPSSGGGVDARH